MKTVSAVKGVNERSNRGIGKIKMFKFISFVALALAVLALSCQGKKENGQIQRQIVEEKFKFEVFEVYNFPMLIHGLIGNGKIKYIDLEDEVLWEVEKILPSGISSVFSVWGTKYIGYVGNGKITYINAFDGSLSGEEIALPSGIDTVFSLAGTNEIGLVGNGKISYVRWEDGAKLPKYDDPFSSKITSYGREITIPSGISSVFTYSDSLICLVGNGKITFVNWDNGNPIGKEIILPSGVNSAINVKRGIIGLVEDGKISYINDNDGTPTGKEILITDKMFK
jgi:hypothetical protein